MIQRIVRGVFSPTRAVAEFVKERRPDGGAGFIRLWNWTFFLVAPATCVLLYVAPPLGISGAPATY